MAMAPKTSAVWMATSSCTSSIQRLECTPSSLSDIVFQRGRSPWLPGRCPNCDQLWNKRRQVLLHPRRLAGQDRHETETVLGTDMVRVDQPIRPAQAGRSKIAIGQSPQTGRAEPIPIRGALNLAAWIGAELQTARIAGVQGATNKRLRIAARIPGKVFDAVPVAHQQGSKVQIEEVDQL